MTDHQLVEVYRSWWPSRYRQAVCSCGVQVWFRVVSRPRFRGDLAVDWQEAETAIDVHRARVQSAA